MAVAREGAAVRIAPAVARASNALAAIVERFAAGDRKVYGLNTGLGAAVDTALSPDEVAAFQRQAVMARAVGVGDFLATDEVRAALFVRLVGIAHGASGLSPPWPRVIRDMLGKGVHPSVRRIGTLGEADLSPWPSFSCRWSARGRRSLAAASCRGARRSARPASNRLSSAPRTRSRC